MAQGIPTIKLTAYEGDTLVSEQTYERDVINIGKLTRSHLRLEDANISRMHAVIEVTRSGDVEIADLGSTNGTLVNGQRINRSPLKTGDEILVGNTRILVEIFRATPSRAAEPQQPGRRRQNKPTPVPMPPELKIDTYVEQREADTGSGKFAAEVILMWGTTVLAARHFPVGRRVTIGGHKGCDILMPEEIVGSDAFELIEPNGNDFVLNIPPKVVGLARIGNEVTTIEALRGRSGGKANLTQNSRFRLDFGHLTVLVGYKELAKKPRTIFLGRINVHEQIYMALSLVAHLAFLIMLSLIPEEQLYARRDPHKARASLIAAIQVAEQEKQEKEKEELREEEKEKESDPDFLVEEKKVIKVEEKQVVRPEIEIKEKKDDALLNKLTPEERKERNKEVVKSAGLNKVLNETDLLNDIMDSGDVMGTGINKPTQIASLGGNAALTTYDPFGGSLATEGGAGSSGFATPMGSVGGGGSLRGSVSGLGKEDVTKGDKGLGKVGLQDKKTTVKVDMLSPTVSDGYDREAVRRVIQAQINQIKWCYQKELQKNPNLAGKVVLSFLIVANGSVQAPKVVNNTMPVEEVGECIAQKAVRWLFPAPPNGGVVKVTYPFMFKAK